MRDQVAAAERAGLRATTINSTNFDEWDAVLADVDAGDVDVLLVSPERLANPRFASRLPTAARERRAWSSSTRPTASPTGASTSAPTTSACSRVLVRTAPGTPVLATTATANERVTDDVAAQLGDRHGHVPRQPGAGVAATLAVVPGLGPLERYAWVADALRDAARLGHRLRAHRRRDRAPRRLPRRAGFAVAAYSGRTPDDERRRIEDQLRDNELKAVVATSALGMGYDKPDLAFCIHVGSPSTPGRLLPAGRPGRPRPRHRRGRAAPGRDRRAASGSTSPPRRSPTPSTRATVLDALATRHRSRALARVGDRHPPRSPRGAAQDPRRRRRGRADAGRVGGHRAAVRRTTPRSGTPSSLARAAAEADLMRGVRARRGLPDGVPPARARRPRPRAVRSLLGVHRDAARARATSRRPSVCARRASCSAASTSIIEPRLRWPGGSRSGRSGTDRRLHRRPGARLRRRSRVARRAGGVRRRRPRRRARRRSPTASSRCCRGGDSSGPSVRSPSSRCRHGHIRAACARSPSTSPPSASSRCSTCWTASGPPVPSDLASSARADGLFERLECATDARRARRARSCSSTTPTARAGR